MQFSTAVLTAMVGQLQTAVGTTGAIRIFSGAKPADCTQADPTGLLVTINLPQSFLIAASGSATLTGQWQANASTTTTATALSFRMYNVTSGVYTCHHQGTVGLSGSNADLILNNTSISQNQLVQVTQWTIGTAGNA